MLRSYLFSYLFSFTILSCLFSRSLGLKGLHTNGRYFLTHKCKTIAFGLSDRASAVLAEGSGSPCRIKVIGVGGGGGNAINRMVQSETEIEGVEMWAVNTDAQALSKSLASKKLNIGAVLSRF